ncbi:hypothetical protein OSL53_14570, partial [Escherichia coli]|nr:hypothetical protein [Escherichia coli]
ADRNRSHWSTSKTPSYTKSVSWQHHPTSKAKVSILEKRVISQNQQTVDFNFCEYFLQSVMHGLGLLIFIPFVVFL